MKPLLNTWILALAVLATLLIAGNAFADPISNSFGNNVTIWDKWSSNNLSPSPFPGEDQEVEPPDLWGQTWDMEGFFLKGNALTMIGGFDFVNGQLDPLGRGVLYHSGDIFIGTMISSVKYGAGIGTSYGSEALINNGFGYDYVIHVNWTGGTYTVLQIDPSSKVKTPYFQANSYSAPWIYWSGGQQLGTL